MREDMSDFPRSELDPVERAIQDAALDYWAAKATFEEAGTRVQEALVVGRAHGKGPSRMSRLTGLTREWVARLAPEAKASE